MKWLVQWISKYQYEFNIFNVLPTILSVISLVKLFLFYAIRLNIYSSDQFKLINKWLKWLNYSNTNNKQYSIYQIDISYCWKLYLNFGCYEANRDKRNAFFFVIAIQMYLFVWQARTFQMLLRLRMEEKKQHVFVKFLLSFFFFVFLFQRLCKLLRHSYLNEIGIYRIQIVCFGFIFYEYHIYNLVQCILYMTGTTFLGVSFHVVATDSFTNIVQDFIDVYNVLFKCNVHPVRCPSIR